MTTLRGLLLARPSMLLLIWAVLASAVLIADAREDIANEIEASGRLADLLVAVMPERFDEQRYREFEAVLDRMTPTKNLRHLDVQWTPSSNASLPIARREVSVEPALSWWQRLLLPVAPSNAADRIKEVEFPGGLVGIVTLRPTASSEIREVGAQTVSGLGLLLALVAAVGGSLWALSRRALVPLTRIVDGAGRLERGDWSVQLAPERIAEFDAIAASFNRLVTTLQATLDARQHLVRRLLALQEEEQRRLAAELHDEFGQVLTAISVDGAFLRQRCREDGQAAAVAEEIETCAIVMLEQVRGMLRSLRPYGLGTQDLRRSIEDLCGSWRQRGLPVEAPEIDEAVGVMSGAPAIAIYRVVQETLTNCARHARASRVRVRVLQASPDRDIEVRVDNDGVRAGEGSPVPGLGLLGITERVSACGGSVRWWRPSPTTFEVGAVFPRASVAGIDGAG